MPQQVMSSVDNNFTKGLITEATGLNFPENAATSTSNCEFTLIGDVVRRLGINFELNGSNADINRIGSAVNSYVWNNAGGLGTQSYEVVQVGNLLYIYNITAATIGTPLSGQISPSPISINTFTASGGTFDPTQECTFADGNGYLFVFHPSCDPFYVTGAGSFTTGLITLQIRDFIGITATEGPITNRPPTLSLVHEYNLINQGWNNGVPWSASSTSGNLTNIGVHSWTIPTGMTINNGDYFYALVTSVTGQPVAMSGSVQSYTSSSGLLTAWMDTITGQVTNNSYSSWSLVSNSQTIPTFQQQIGVYPSNADIWWTFKDNLGLFSPSKTFTSQSSNTDYAPKGHVILNLFNQDRSTASGIPPGITPSTITSRPTTGAWFQGRAWYAGVSAASDSYGYNWTETIYFSQITTNPTQFGFCYQQNDPTSENLNSLLATDGGAITIQGAGSVNKLFATQNGMLVFADNGVWFITGSRGIGFSPDDYTVTKISAVRTFSNTSFVDVLGLPYFWNEEGIYKVAVSQTGSLAVEPLTVGTIQSYYDDIPLSSKRYVRGAYDPINYVIKWVYKSTVETDITDRYAFDSILNYNTYNQAFYTYFINNTSSRSVNGINYISYPVIGSTTPNPGFKYPASITIGSTVLSFAEEYDTTYFDWGLVSYTSSFTTGYKLPGQAWKKFQVPYVYVYLRNNGYSAYYIQAAWDYAIDFDSNKWSQPQFAEVNDSNSSMFVKRHKMRGRGRAIQFMFTSVPGQPFDFMGWAVYDNVNTSV